MLESPLILQQHYKIGIITLSAIEGRTLKPSGRSAVPKYISIAVAKCMHAVNLGFQSRQSRSSDGTQKSKVMLCNEHFVRPGRTT